MKQSIQNEKTRFHCEVCIPFQKWAMENGKSHACLRCLKQASVNNILASTASLQFSGLVQVEEHAVSEWHKLAVDFFQTQGTTTKKQQTSKQSSEKRKSTCQPSISKLSCSLNEKRPLDHLQQPKLEKVKCYYLWDPDVVKHFKDDHQIRHWTVKGLFLFSISEYFWSTRLFQNSERTWKLPGL